MFSGILKVLLGLKDCWLKLKALEVQVPPPPEAGVHLSRKQEAETCVGLSFNSRPAPLAER